MKIYIPRDPVFMIRVTIKQGNIRKYFAIEESTLIDVFNFLQSIVKSKIKEPFVKGVRITVICREALGGKNMKTKSFSFYGMNAEDLYKTVLSKFDKVYKV